MSLNEIKLHPAQMADLYRTQLVHNPGNSENPAAGEKTDFPYLGSYQKRILILVREPDHVFISDMDLQFLTGILSACKLSMAEVGIVNLHAQPTASMDLLQDSLSPNAWWIFCPIDKGKDIGGSFSYMHPTLQQNAPVFSAPPLQQLSKDPEAKRNLWEQLKKHYIS